jgi:hypothetical protein
MLAPLSAMAADVDVYAEGAYTDTDLVIYIYADIAGVDPLCSFGVLLNYDDTRLTVSTATKNENVWYFGTTSAKEPYMDPDTSSAGQIIFIGGKLDTGAPTAGVTGTRTLLGIASFTRDESGAPGTTPETYFGISLAVGKGGDYDNFVTVGGTVMEETTGGVAFVGDTVRERGDANGDGDVDLVDARIARQIFLGLSPWSVLADCNADGDVDLVDARCMRQIFLGL